MPYINVAQRVIQFKIVLYGTVGAGKATTVKSLHRLLKSARKGDIISIPVGGDQTLMLDLASFVSKELNKFSVHLQVWTLTGSLEDPAPRRLLLKGADGVVLVMDSLWERMPDNAAAFQSLHEHMMAHDLSSTKVPIVLQVNKRDLPDIAPIEFFQFSYKQDPAPAAIVSTIATQGYGVVDTLNTLTRLVISQHIQNSQGGASAGG